MINTPKSKQRLSYTRSLQQLSKSTERRAWRVIHGSLTKQQIINYNTILNKLLAMQNYQKFMLLASKFVDREILQCKQQPNRLSVVKGLQNHLISDGLFIRKLAQLSGHQLMVINHFINHIKKNKKYLRELESNIKKIAIPAKLQQEFQNENENCDHGNQTEEERDIRLNGYHKGSEISNGKENKILYSEYVKMNRKSMEIYQKVKNRLAGEQKFYDCNNKSLQSIQKLKRVSIREDSKLHSKAIESLQLKSLSKLSIVQQQLLKLFPAIRYIGHLCPQITVRKLIQSLGTFKGYEVKKVAIQVEQEFQIDLNFINLKTKQDFPIIQHAIIMQKITNCQQNNMEKNVTSDSFVRIYLTD